MSKVNVVQFPIFARSRNALYVSFFLFLVLAWLVYFLSSEFINFANPLITEENGLQYSLVLVGIVIFIIVVFVGILGTSKYWIYLFLQQKLELTAGKILIYKNNGTLVQEIKKEKITKVDIYYLLTPYDRLLLFPEPLRLGRANFVIIIRGEEGKIAEFEIRRKFVKDLQEVLVKNYKHVELHRLTSSLVWPN